MSQSPGTNGLLFSKLASPFYQTNIGSVQTILDTFGLSINEKVVMEAMYAIGMLPLDKDPLKQQTLLEMVSVFSARGYNDIAHRLLSVILKDSNLCIETEEAEL